MPNSPPPRSQRKAGASSHAACRNAPWNRALSSARCSSNFPAWKRRSPPMTAWATAKRWQPLENSPANAICASSRASNRRTDMRLRRIGPLAIVAVSQWLSGCGINNIPTEQAQAKAAWSEVQNQYQRRADLIPNLVNTVKGFAQQEQKVLID